MRYSNLAFPTLMAVFLAGCAPALDSELPPAAAAPAPSAQELVSARQGGMKMSVFALGTASRAAESEEPVSKARLAVTGLADFSLGVAGLFRADTAAIENTKARPEIWSDAAGFKARVEQYQLAAAGLRQAAIDDNREAFQTALVQTKAACKACHDSFRVEQ